MAPRSVQLVTGQGTLSAPERRLLAAMPLHAITVLHGEGGLRERLLAESGRFPGAERDRIEDALGLMSRLHAADRRQREPYACHPLRGAVRILSHYRVNDVDVACAALLHDTVEDHAGDIAPGGREDALAALAGQFCGRVAELVGAVTNPAREPGRDRHEQYREHVAASLEDSPWARVIKVSDITDNAVGLFHTTGDSLPRRAAKYRPLVPVLRELVLRLDTPLEDDVKRMIAGQLDKAGGRLAAICGEPGDSPRMNSNRLPSVSVSSGDDTRPTWGWPRCESSTTGPAATARMTEGTHLAGATAHRSRAASRSQATGLCGTQRPGRLMHWNTVSASKPPAGSTPSAMAMPGLELRIAKPAPGAQLREPPQGICRRVPGGLPRDANSIRKRQEDRSGSLTPGRR